MKKDNNLLDYVPRIPEKLNWTEDDEHRVTVDVENKGVFNRIAQKCFGRPARMPSRYMTDCWRISVHCRGMDL